MLSQGIWMLLGVDPGALAMGVAALGMGLGAVVMDLNALGMDLGALGMGLNALGVDLGVLEEGACWRRESSLALYTSNDAKITLLNGIVLNTKWVTFGSILLS